MNLRERIALADALRAWRELLVRRHGFDRRHDRAYLEHWELAHQ